MRRRRDGSGRQFSIQHTLQSADSGTQIAEERSAVIQMVILGLEQRAETRGLEGAGHAAGALDGVADAANFSGVAFGDCGVEGIHAPGKIDDDRG